MGKRKKEHRKRVLKRNQRLKNQEKYFMKNFKEEFLKQIELMKKNKSNQELEDNTL